MERCIDPDSRDMTAFVALCTPGFKSNLPKRGICLERSPSATPWECRLLSRTQKKQDFSQNPFFQAFWLDFGDTSNAFFITPSLKFLGLWSLASYFSYFNRLVSIR